MLQEILRKVSDKKLVFVVEDALDHQKMIEAALAAEFELVFFSDAKEIVQRVSELQPSLVLLDIVLPIGDGFQALEDLMSCERTRDCPILFVTGKSGHEDIGRGFQLGADDYILKPFHPLDLKIRCEARIRQAEARKGQKENSSTGAITLNPLSRRVQVSTEDLAHEFDLTPAEFQLLSLLLQNKNRALTRSEIKHAIFPKKGEVESDRAIDNHISQLRKKSLYLSSRISSVYGVGYRFSLDAVE